VRSVRVRAAYHALEQPIACGARHLRRRRHVLQNY
jgi:hypothetical protein